MNNNDEMLERVTKAIGYTGYPFELRVGNTLRNRGWIPFHTVKFYDPTIQNLRELDILAYKIINDTRVELRISCKKSISKPWVFFTDESSNWGSACEPIVTPLQLDHEWRWAVDDLLEGLPYFNHKRIAINYTAFCGKKFKDEARHQITDGISECLSSVYLNLYPDQLIWNDQRTLYLFVLLYNGNMFQAYYNADTDTDTVERIHRCQWENQVKLQSDTKQIYVNQNKQIPIEELSDYFDNWFKVEIIEWTDFEEWISEVENAIMDIDQDALNLLGSPWIQLDAESLKNSLKIVNSATDLDEIT